MSQRDWSRAEEITWEHYYEWVKGRDLRQVFVDALPLLPDPSTDGRTLVAVDVGCGDGKEALVLLAAGWAVTAIDGSPDGIARLLDAVPPNDAGRLTTGVVPFAEAEIPPADLVYAGFSLPFCDPADFGSLWSRIVAALRPGGVFAGNLFGPHDTWFGTPDMTFHSRASVQGLFDGFDIVSLREEDEDGSAASGPKHWHVFHVIARKCG
jgi:SAM-dependent methyltransferase